MDLALLGCLLLLLLAQGKATERKGETCRVWMDWTGLSVGFFQCPRASDEANATFCCGTCQLPFCCSTAGARLDQQQCAPDGHLEAIGSHRHARVTAKRPTYLAVWVLLIWILPLGMSALVVSICVICIIFHMRNQPRIRDWLRSPVDEQPLDEQPLEEPLFSQPALTDPPYLRNAPVNTDPPSPAAEDPQSPCDPLSALDTPPATQCSHPMSAISRDEENISSPMALPTNVQVLPLCNPRKRNRLSNDVVSDGEVGQAPKAQPCAI